MSLSHLQFICPHCEQVMRVSARFLGQRGRCNRCDGRVHLVGNGDNPAPQRAEVLSSATTQRPDGALLDNLEEQALQNCWRALAPEDPLPGMDAPTLRCGLRQLIEAPVNDEAISGKTRGVLLRLGLERNVIDKLGSERKACQIHEELHLQPTVHQRQALHALGVKGAAIAAARSRGLARLLIEARLLQED